LLDDPGVVSTSEQFDYMPYWGYLWPSALALAHWLAEASLPSRLRTLEIGCGLGLPGLVALDRGYQVAFNDYALAALSGCAQSARRNGFRHFELLPFDWCYPPRRQFDLILGSDVFYEHRCLLQVARLLALMLRPKGRDVLVDPNRPTADRFPEVAADTGLIVTHVQALGRQEDVSLRLLLVARL
jgi:predicted nicotinamide N-methyase